jgi:UDP-glucose 4-epimerase
MRYIITGGAGFIGSNLAEKLLLLNCNVSIIDDLSTGQINNIRPLLAFPNCRFIRGDINEHRTWAGVVEKDDTIIHLAATVGVKKVCEDPFQTLTNNLKGIESVLRIALYTGCKVVYASSSEVYGQSEKPVLREDESLRAYAHQGGRSSYVLSKILGEHYCLNYYQAHKLPVIVCRLFNIAGPNQLSLHGMVVPTFIQQALSQLPITIYGDGEQRRSFCNVRDLADAVYTLVNSDNSWGEVFNIGNSETITINSLASFVKHETGSSSPIVHIPLPFERSDGKDIHHRTPCIQKIKAFTGWCPQISWRQTVRDVISYEQKIIQEQPLTTVSKHEFIYG